MPPLWHYEKGITLWRWVLILYLLLAPRVVGHRHVDVCHAGAASDALAMHLAKCHPVGPIPIDEHDVHFHFSFPLLPSEIPSGPAVENLPLGLEIFNCSDLFPPDIAASLDQIVWNDRCPCFPPTRDFVGVETSDLRRICYCVWII